MKQPNNEACKDQICWVLFDIQKYLKEELHLIYGYSIPNMHVVSLEPKSMEFDQVGTFHRERVILVSRRSDTQLVSLDHEGAILSSRDAD